MSYGEIFAREGFIGNPHKYRRNNPHVLEMVISPDMYEEFAYTWCKNDRIIDMLKFKLRIIGFFSTKHPMDRGRRQDITIYLMRVI